MFVKRGCVNTPLSGFCLDEGQVDVAAILTTEGHVQGGAAVARLRDGDRIVVKGDVEHGRGGAVLAGDFHTLNLPDPWLGVKPYRCDLKHTGHPKSLRKMGVC
jgi:hypothetical protein